MRQISGRPYKAHSHCEVETNPRNYRLSAGGFLAEIDRINLELAAYLSAHPSEYYC